MCFLNIFLLGQGIYRSKYYIGKEIAKLYNEYTIINYCKLSINKK